MAIERIRCPRCEQLSFRREGDTSPFQCQNDTCAQDAEARRLAEPATLTTAEIAADRWNRFGAAVLRDPRTDGWVYYVSFGDRIKIGTSRDVAARLRNLYHDELLAIEPGSTIVERERHQQFSGLRVEGQREWFHDSPALREHIARIRAEHGDPAAILAGAA
ncbi:GIY-YIG nuclease family protein [Microbacterium sp. KR10-403]|uniref:GIY-YIG nuclease family protein n=1 Tax=Microbacterium sp. KR10-403 TaxID=3158581 RepID=UPI0032E3833D